MPRAKNLPGMEMPSIPEIDDAAEFYVQKRNARMKLTEQEADAHDILLDLMKQHGLSQYEFDGHSVYLDSKTKVKVKRKADAEDGDQEED